MPADALFVHIGVLVTRVEHGQQEVLLMKSAGGDEWHPPFGLLASEETLEACANRLVKEQAESTIEGLWLRGIVDEVPRRRLVIWLQGRYIGGKQLFSVADGLTDTGWCPWGTLPQPLIKPFQDLRDGRALEGSQGGRGGTLPNVGPT